MGRKHLHLIFACQRASVPRKNFIEKKPRLTSDERNKRPQNEKRNT